MLLHCADISLQHCCCEVIYSNFGIELFIIYSFLVLVYILILLFCFVVVRENNCVCF